jgi:3-oxoacyl-[acyl-carrier protein] reductase
MIRALVTGGSGAIGAAVCRRLAAAGRHVIVHANNNLAEAERVVQNIRAHGGTAEAVAFDVTHEQGSAAALERLLADGPVQVVVNNAGIHADAPMAGMSGEQWRSVVDVSLHGFFNVTRALLLPMIGARWGRIISVSSVAALRGNRGQTNYAAAKAGLHGATRSLALELASRGVTVNAIAPGIIASPMTAGSFTDAAIAELVPMKRAGRPEEVAALVDFLASEEAGYISGQVIAIDGALT